MAPQVTDPVEHLSLRALLRPRCPRDRGSPCPEPPRQGAGEDEVQGNQLPAAATLRGHRGGQGPGENEANSPCALPTACPPPEALRDGHRHPPTQRPELHTHPATPTPARSRPPVPAQAARLPAAVGRQAPLPAGHGPAPGAATALGCGPQTAAAGGAQARPGLRRGGTELSGDEERERNGRKGDSLGMEAGIRSSS